MWRNSSESSEEGFCDLRGEEVVREQENKLGTGGWGLGQEQKNGGLAGSAGPSWLSGSRLKWRLDQMGLSSAQIGAGSGSGSSRRLAGAAATLERTKFNLYY